MATNPFEMDDLLGVYALDAVDDDERRAVEEYLATSPRARAEVQQHREVATMLAWSGMDAPDGLWDKIAGSLEGSESAPESVLGRVLPMRSSRRRSWGRTAGSWALATAAAALIAFVAVRVASNSSDASMSAPIERAVAAAFANPKSVQAQMTSVNESSLKVRAVVDPEGNGYLLADSLPRLDPSRTYQLWGQIDGELISLGILGSDPKTAGFSVHGKVTLLAITDEAGGGVISSTQPVVVKGVPS